MSSIRIAVVEAQEAIPTSTPYPQSPILQATPIPPLPTSSFSFDRHDPESVILAFFDAWERRDGNTMASLQGQSYLQYAFSEPLDSIRVLEIKLISSPSQIERVYSATFDIQMKKGQDGLNLHNGQMQWTFTLEWNSSRDSWFITNHGIG